MKAKRITAFLLAAVMLMSLVPFGMISVFAEDTTAPAALPDSTAQQLRLAAWADSHAADFSLDPALAGKAYTLSDNLLGENALITDGENEDDTATAEITAAIPEENVAGILVRMTVNGAAAIANNNGFQYTFKVGSDTYVTSAGGSGAGVPVYEYDNATKTWAYFSCPNSHAMRAVDNFDGYVFVPLTSLRRNSNPANMRNSTVWDQNLASKLLANGISAITVNQSWGKGLNVSSVQYVYVDGYTMLADAYTLPGANVMAWNIGFPNAAVSTTHEALQMMKSSLAADVQGIQYSVDAMEVAATSTVSHAKFAAGTTATVYEISNSKPIDGALGIMLTVDMPAANNNNGLVVALEVNGKLYYNLSFKEASYSYFKWDGTNEWYMNSNWNYLFSGALDANRTERTLRYPADFKGTVFIPLESFNQVYAGDGVSAYNGTKLNDTNAEVKLTAADLKTYGISKVIPMPIYENKEMTVSDMSFVYPATTPMLTISTADEFVAFLNNIDDYDTQLVVLANDIDMTGKAWPTFNNSTDTRYFSGILDGQGHAINNISIKYSAHHTAPFGHTLAAGKAATFKNLTLGGTVDCGGKWQKGGLYFTVAGALNIDNVTNNLDVKNTNGDMGGYVGNVSASGTAIFTNSSLNGYVQGKWSGNVGGFVSGNSGTVVIDNCIMNAEVTNTLATSDSGKSGDLGGFVAECKDGAKLTITNSVMTGSVVHCSNALTTDAFTGGFLAYLRNGGEVIMENCVQLGMVQAIRSNDNSYAGGFIGQIENVDDAENPNETNSATLKNCSFYGVMMHSKDDAAGFIGNANADSVTLIDCTYAGAVMIGTDTVAESGSFFFNDAVAGSLKDCAGNQYVTYEGLVDLNETSALLTPAAISDAEDADSKADYYGYQTKVTEGVGAVRLVGHVDALTYDKVGVKYTMIATGADKLITTGNLDTTTVYTSLKGETETYANTDADAAYNGEYFFALTLDNVATEGDVFIIVTTYHVEDDVEIVDEMYGIMVEWEADEPVEVV